MILINGQSFAQIGAQIGLGSLTMGINEINKPDGANTVAFPREYDVYGSMGSVYGAGFLIASKNYQTRLYHDPASGQWRQTENDTIIPYFVVEATTNYYSDLAYATVPVPNGFKRYWRYAPPVRIVDETNYSETDWQVFDHVDENLIADQVIVATCNTACGISFTQKAYAFANPHYDHFIIVEYIYKNTGNINGSPEIEYPDNQVLDCYLGLKFVPQPSGLTRKIIPGAGGWNAEVDDWIDYYLGDYNEAPIRVLYGWDGDAGSSYQPADDEADPLPASGIFMSPQYPGFAILQVDRAVNDNQNDPDQPRMGYYSYGGSVSSNTLSIRSSGLGAESIHNILSSSFYFDHPFDWDQWNLTQTENWKIDNNPNREYYKTGTFGFGPYNFIDIGDSVKIVACYTVGSMGWNKAVEAGDKWRQSETSQIEKNQMIRTGRDTLFKYISEVSELFIDGNGNFNMDQGSEQILSVPEAPDLIINSSVRQVNLKFKDTNESLFRVYRRLKPSFLLEDTPSELLKVPYPMIGEVDRSELQMTPDGYFLWSDKDVSGAGNFWYAVTAVNEVGVESSPFQTRTDPTETNPTRGSAVVYQEASTTLDSIYAVPNPYHIKGDRLYKSVNFPSKTIRFVGLPAQCRIRIFTQSGDLVATINHELSLPPSDSEDWKLKTETDQFVASGLYIFLVDQAKDGLNNDLGLSKVGKLVIIR